MSERNEPNRYEELQIDSVLFHLNPAEQQELEELQQLHDPPSTSYESLAGLVELTHTEIVDMPQGLQGSILESGKQFIQQQFGID